MSFSFNFGVVLSTDSNESAAISRAKNIISKYLSEDELATVILLVEGERVKIDSSQSILLKIRKGLDEESPMAILGS